MVLTNRFLLTGFMSSGLEIKQSIIREKWVCERLWINLSSLGLQSIQLSRSPDVEMDSDDEQTEYKSDWLNHMSLMNDMKSERDGVQVRPIDGLAGVDYLTPGSLMKYVSYVFGPVLDALEEAGYVREKNLDAMSYDWRLSPVQMEARDGYFSRVMDRVEQMYNDNNKTPVVIMCHSLGCKVGHYFLNFCLDAKGQDWLDKYIHTYMPVGGPHLGAPKALRSTISGDKMGLDTFLSGKYRTAFSCINIVQISSGSANAAAPLSTDSEALAFGRSLGSGPWLFPAKLPPGAPSPFYFHPQGVVEVSVTSLVNAKPMLAERRMLSKTKKFKLSMVYNDNVVTTEYHSSNEDGTVLFDEVFCFATAPDGPNTAKGDSDLLQILLLEPGVSASKHEKEHRSCIRKLLCLPFKILCILPILFCCLVKHFTILSAEAVSRAIGGSTILAASEPINVSEAISKRNNSMEVDLFYGEDRERNDGEGCCCCKYKTNPERITIRISWTPPAKKVAPKRGSIIAVKSDDKEDPKMANRTDCSDLLEREGLDAILTMIQEVYDSDPLGPRNRSSTKAPPVKRIKAIYGINLSTEIGAVYCRRPAAIESPTENRFEPDSDAKLSKQSKAGGEKLKGGVLYETSKKKQSDGRFCSGDGTVPYYSLSYVKTWENDCNVEVTELDKAEHREILADPRFHKAVLDYTTVSS